jgi:hypothetical protein
MQENQLIDNVVILTSYVEDLKINLDCVAEARKLLLKYQLFTDMEMVDNHEKEAVLSKLIDIEIQLTKSIASQDLNSVTIESLKATRSIDGKSTITTITGFYLVSLWLVMLLVVGGAIYLQYRVAVFEETLSVGGIVSTSIKHSMYFVNAINPFLFGTLGACVYLMRITSTRLHNRTFNPSRIPEHINRLFLGTVSGGIVILFLEDGVILGSPGKGVPITAAGIGFIAGYSIEFLYQVIDRIIKAVLPTISSSFDPSQVEIKKRKMLIQRYEKDLIKANKNRASKEIIELLEQLINDLK